MTTTEGSEPVRDLRGVDVYAADLASRAERDAFLDDAALAALPSALAEWRAYKEDPNNSDFEFDELRMCAAGDAYDIAEAMLAERERRRGKK